MKAFSPNDIRTGRNIGALIGAVLFFGPGLLPGLFAASFGASLLLSRLGLGLGEPHTFVRILHAVMILVGVMLAGAVSVAVGAVFGWASALVFRLFLAAGPRGDGALERRNDRAVYTFPHGRIKAGDEAGIRSQLAFLDGYAADIRSLVVVGSAAYGTRRLRSDIDVVVIATASGHARVAEYLGGREIDAAMGPSTHPEDFEFTVLSEGEARDLFEKASPFAWALRYGLVLTDDGYLETLVESTRWRVPDRAWNRKALKETIAVAYLGAAEAVRRDIRRRRCSEACCRNPKDCPGLSSGDIFFRTTMRMLYVALPARGYMPLTKDDVFLFADRVYGEQARDALSALETVRRSGRHDLYYAEYRRLENFVLSLFDEVVATAGSGAAVRRFLADVRRLVDGHHGGVGEGRLKEILRAI